MAHDVLIQLVLDSGTKYYSFRDIQMPTQFYEGRILGMGEIGSEISVIPAELMVDSFSLELNNADGAISELKASESFINREIKVYLGDVSDSTSFTQQARFPRMNYPMRKRSIVCCIERSTFSPKHRLWLHTTPQIRSILQEKPMM